MIETTKLNIYFIYYAKKTYFMLTNMRKIIREIITCTKNKKRLFRKLSIICL
jgi:hypothetical protein